MKGKRESGGVHDDTRVSHSGMKLYHRTGGLSLEIPPLLYSSHAPSYSLITYTIFSRLPFISTMTFFAMREKDQSTYLGGKAVISAKLQQYWRYVQYNVIQASQTVLRVYSGLGGEKALEPGMDIHTVSRHMCSAH